MVAAVPGVEHHGAYPFASGEQPVRARVSQGKMLHIGVQLDALHARLQHPLHFPAGVLHVRVEGAKAPQPVGVFVDGADEKIIDVLHLPGLHRHGQGQAFLNAHLVGLPQQVCHGAVPVHGNVVKIADRFDRLCRDLFGIYMGVAI